MKAQLQNVDGIGLSAIPTFHPDRTVMLEFQEPKEYIRQRVIRGQAALSRRERFLINYAMLIAVVLGGIALSFFPATPKRLSWQGILMVGILGSVGFHIICFRLPLWLPFSRVGFAQRHLSVGTVRIPYRKFVGYYFTQRDGFDLVCLRFAGEKDREGSSLGVKINLANQREIALPNANWKEPVRSALMYVGLDEVAH